MAFKKRRGKSSQRFVAMPHYMLAAPAFTTLPGEAVKILLDLWRRHNGANNGEISYSVREAEELGISKSTAARMFDVLEERGFLAKVRNSGFSVKIKMARTWRITAEPRGEERATKDFMRWTWPVTARGSEGPATFKARSHQRDTQSHQRDSDRKVETKLPVLVPPAGPCEVNTAYPRSHQRDTYNIPGGGDDRPDIHFVRVTNFNGNGQPAWFSSPFPLTITEGPKGWHVVVTAWPPIRIAA